MIKLRNEGIPKYRLDYTRDVRVYKNLHRRCYSVQQDGLVKAHIDLDDVFYIESAYTKVFQAGRNRVLLEKKKNVHAFICGLLKYGEESDRRCSRRISYNPYKGGEFMVSGTPCLSALRVEFAGESIYV